MPGGETRVRGPVPSLPTGDSPMTLHRDVLWLGRQWAVTGYGIQAVDKKLEGKFDIEACRLGEDDLSESMLSQPWFNTEDFTEALAVARARFREASVPLPAIPATPRNEK